MKDKIQMITTDSSSCKIGTNSHIRSFCAPNSFDEYEITSPGSSMEVETHLSSKINNYLCSTSTNEPGYMYGSWKFDRRVQFNISTVLGIQGSTLINY